MIKAVAKVFGLPIMLVVLFMMMFEWTGQFIPGVLNFVVWMLFIITSACIVQKYVWRV